ncbi:MAG: DUF2892 domain-containing protein [candidate division Zixibacteria bacterium]|nr:DUF2892 domain-containing protein [candidate division Zixibacteria bacterium]
MTLENSIRLMAGTLVLLSLALGYFMSPYWFLLTAFVGFNLVQSSFTKFCPAEMIFMRLFSNKK